MSTLCYEVITQDNASGSITILELEPDCITLEDGQQVYNRIYTALKNKMPITLDFSKVDFLTSPFLNAAIGRLLKDFDESDVKSLVIDHVIGLDEHRSSRLLRVVEYSLNYFSNENERKAVDKALKEMSNNPEEFV
jgi:STAS-like domain of unknown function (DUF4325)